MGGSLFAVKFLVYFGACILITASIGVTCYSEKFESVRAFVERADQMMYQAKNEGRSRTILWDDGEQFSKDPAKKEVNYAF